MNKKAVGLFLVLSLAVILGACGGGTDTTTPAESPSPAASPSP
jgi:hypothetical protein